MKLSVILTGGTISSEARGGVISLAEPPAKRLEAAYKNAGGTAQLAFTSPFTALSEALSAENLNMLVEAVLREYAGGAEKIIICHGTDTLQYSAAAVLYALAGKRCTAVFVSAAKPLDDRDTNGFENFNAAAFFLERYDAYGVFAAYQNKGENARILPAETLALHAERSDSLCCVGGEYAAEYVNGKVTLNSLFKQPKSRELGFAPRFEDTAGIRIVTAAPGQAYPPCESGVRAVLLKPYHSGTLNTASAAFSAFCRDAKHRDIPLFAVDIMPGAQYESTLAFEKLSICALKGAAFAAIYIKIWLAGDMRGSELQAFVKNSVAGELEF